MDQVVKDQIMGALNDLPNKIKIKEQEVWDLKEKILLQEDKEQKHKNIVMAEVNSMTDPETQKAMYSNDIKRKLALDNRLSLSTEYKSLENDILASKKLMYELESDLKYLERRFRAAEGMTRILGL